MKKENETKKNDFVLTNGNVTHHITVYKQGKEGNETFLTEVSLAGIGDSVEDSIFNLLQTARQISECDIKINYKSGASGLVRFKDCQQ